jgi:hypothetical protein
LTFQTPSPPLVQYYETTTTQALVVIGYWRKLDSQLEKCMGV